MKTHLRRISLNSIKNRTSDHPITLADKALYRNLQSPVCYSTFLLSRNLQNNPPKYFHTSDKRMYSQTQSTEVIQTITKVHDNQEAAGSIDSINKYSRNDECEYSNAIKDLNSLQSNNQVVALAKYKKPETILPLFRRQLELAGIKVADLDRLNIIHVSGTKGKGSTCAFTESILRSFNEGTKQLKIGTYTSPHLVKVTERIKLDGVPISEIMFGKYFRIIYDKLLVNTRRDDVTMPSYFSLLTILAFHVFLEENVDCAIIEVGMGGNYDPTNVIEKPVACCITTLDLDHTNILGKTIEKISRTKAGIIKPGVPIYTIEHEHPEAMKIIEAQAREKAAPLYVCRPPPDGLTQSGITLGIQGDIQIINASLACHLAAHVLKHKFGYPVKFNSPDTTDGLATLNRIETDLSDSDDFIKRGLTECSLPGRCQVISYPEIQTTFFIDGAHTTKSMANCLDWFNQKSHSLDSNPIRILLINVIGDRDRCEVLKPLLKTYRIFDYIIFTTNKLAQTNDMESQDSETFVRNQDLQKEKNKENARLNMNAWLSLLSREDPEATASHEDKILIRPTTFECLRFVNRIRYVLDNNDCPRNCHVLATGSLHFVGAILETLHHYKGRDIVINL